MAIDTPLEEVLDLVPELRGPRDISELPGGLTNTNLRVATSAGIYVVRRWSADTSLLAIDRDNEYENSVAAADAGAGAPVVAYLPDHNTLVLNFVDGKTLSPRDLDDSAMLKRAATACRKLHAAKRFRDDFDMFEIQPRYLRIVQERGFRLPDRYLEFEPQVAAIHEALAHHPEPWAPCNNDLLAENFIDDGDRLWLIDYEYSGNNEPSFELGNIWSESTLSPDRLGTLVTSYYGAPLRNKVARARLWGLMSKYGWTLWASIQDGVSTIDFDFWSWGMQKYTRAVAEFDGPNFERLLADVVRPD